MPYKDIRDFTAKLTIKEKGKKQVPIGQVSEILKCANELLEGELYPLIKGELIKEKIVEKKVKDKNIGFGVELLSEACNEWENSRKNKDAGDVLVSKIKEFLG